MLWAASRRPVTRDRRGEQMPRAYIVASCSAGTPGIPLSGLTDDDAPARAVGCCKVAAMSAVQPAA